jgi:hypothetical protein
MPYGQAPESIGAVGCPIVDRAGLELVQPLIVVTSIMNECFEAGLTPGLIEPAPREQHSRRVNALLDFAGAVL